MALSLVETKLDSPATGGCRVKYRLLAALAVGGVLALALTQAASISQRGAPVDGSPHSTAPGPAPTSDELPAGGQATAWPRELLGGNAESCAHAAADALGDEALIKQIVITGVAADTSADSPPRLRDVGGYILTGRSSRGATGTADLVRHLAEQSDVTKVRPLFSVDQEGGKVQVLSGPGFSPIPDAETQGSSEPLELRKAASQWGAELAAAGVALNLAPVADVVEKGLLRRNEPIGIPRRSFSTDPEKVVAAAAAVSRGNFDAGIATTFKHFPGLGAVVGNTDYKRDVVDSTTDESSSSVDVYRKLLSSANLSPPGHAAVMISTASYSKLDAGVPAAFSRRIVTDLLRDKLGFTGVVVSDDLASAAQVASTPVGQRAVNFLAAGGDLVISVDSKATEAMLAGVASRFRSDPAVADRVRASAVRILTMKATLGLVNCPQIRPTH